MNNTKLLNTQFYAEENKENIKVYLLGYTGWRFPSRMFIPHIKKIYKPNREILETAKKFKKRLREADENISFSIKENIKRFNDFIDNYEYYLNQRLNLLEELILNCL